MSKVKLKQQQRRSQIIETAIPLICSVPFDELSVAEICEAAGISVGTFYHYFQKKSDLLIGLLGLIDEFLEEDVFPLLTCGDEIENLKLFAHGWAEHVEAHGLERSKLISSIEPVDIEPGGAKRAAVVKLEEIISRGQEKGQIIPEPDAAALAEIFLLAFRGVTTDWSRHNGSYSVIEKMDMYIALFTRALRP